MIFYRNCWKLLPPSYYWYHFRGWLHDEFGLHRLELRDYDKKLGDKIVKIPYRRCSFCGTEWKQNYIEKM